MRSLSDNMCIVLRRSYFLLRCEYWCRCFSSLFWVHAQSAQHVIEFLTRGDLNMNHSLCVLDVIRRTRIIKSNVSVMPKSWSFTICLGARYIEVALSWTQRRTHIYGSVVLTSSYREYLIAITCYPSVLRHPSYMLLYNNYVKRTPACHKHNNHPSLNNSWSLN